jgi:hypothetical protein
VHSDRVDRSAPSPPRPSSPQRPTLTGSSAMTNAMRAARSPVCSFSPAPSRSAGRLGPGLSNTEHDPITGHLTLCDKTGHFMIGAALRKWRISPLPPALNRFAIQSDVLLRGFAESTHRFVMTTSRYSLGTTIVPSLALFIRAMRACRSSFRSLCLASSRAANALSIGP